MASRKLVAAQSRLDRTIVSESESPGHKSFFIGLVSAAA